MNEESSKEKKDLTHILDLAKKAMEEGQEVNLDPSLADTAFHPSDDFSSPAEQVEEFESLEEYSKKNPLSLSAETEKSFDDNLSFQSEPESSSESLSEAPSEAQAKEENEDLFPVSLTPTEPSPELPLEGSLEISANDSAEAPSVPSPALSHELSTEEKSSPLQFEEQEKLETHTIPKPSSDSHSSYLLEKVKDYAEHAPIGETEVAAADPYSLLILGFFEDHEKEKLLSILSSENFGIREVDLEPQFAAGKILIPRISEFAGIVLVQALRDAQVRMRLGPSDEIFATQDTLTQDEEKIIYTSEITHSTVYSPAQHSAASEIPVTPSHGIAEIPHPIVIDAVSASGILNTPAVEATRTTEYLELIESLQDELRFKAFHRGAAAVVSFTVSLTHLRESSKYRILALGTAIRAPQRG